jgi:hypothetical protein
MRMLVTILGSILGGIVLLFLFGVAVYAGPLGWALIVSVVVGTFVYYRRRKGRG